MIRHPCICIRLIHGKVHIILLKLKLILKTQIIIPLCQMKHPTEIGLPKIDPIPTLKPLNIFFLILLLGKYRHLHPLLVIISFFDHVD